MLVSVHWQLLVTLRDITPLRLGALPMTASKGYHRSSPALGHHRAAGRIARLEAGHTAAVGRTAVGHSSAAAAHSPAEAGHIPAEARRSSDAAHQSFAAGHSPVEGSPAAGTAEVAAGGPVGGLRPYRPTICCQFGADDELSFDVRTHESIGPRSSLNSHICGVKTSPVLRSISARS